MKLFDWCVTSTYSNYSTFNHPWNKNCSLSVSRYSSPPIIMYCSRQSTTHSIKYWLNIYLMFEPYLLCHVDPWSQMGNWTSSCSMRTWFKWLFQLLAPSMHISFIPMLKLKRQQKSVWVEFSMVYVYSIVSCWWFWSESCRKIQYNNTLYTVNAFSHPE